jgi:PKD repeat protein
MKIFSLITVIISVVFIYSCSSDSDNPTNPSTKGNITGQITEQGAGNPVSGASISTQPATTTVTSDNSGNYTFSNIEAGSYTVTASKNGYTQNNANANVTAGQTTTVNIILTNTQNIPIASFNYGGTLVTPAVITFTNTSQNADSYLWDFGDGTTSTQANPKKTYNQHGTYTVTLTATNTTSNLTDQTNQNLTIKPGKVFLQKVTLNAFPATNGSGASWDVGSWPDVFFTISDSVTNILYEVPTYYPDLDPATLPVEWTLSPEVQFSNWGKTYYIDLWDYDSISSNEYMGYTNGFKINQLTTYPTTLALQNTSGTIRVTLTLRWQ